MWLNRIRRVLTDSENHPRPRAMSRSAAGEICSHWALALIAGRPVHDNWEHLHHDELRRKDHMLSTHPVQQFPRTVKAPLCGTCVGVGQGVVLGLSSRRASHVACFCEAGATPSRARASQSETCSPSATGVAKLTLGDGTLRVRMGSRLRGHVARHALRQAVATRGADADQRGARSNRAC